MGDSILLLVIQLVVFLSVICIPVHATDVIHAEIVNIDDAATLEYTPCFPVPVVETVDETDVTYTQCGDRKVGNQSLWWTAVEPHQQCFGLSMPERKCSKSTTNQFKCLVGPAWDKVRAENAYPKSQRRRVLHIEVGNWLTMALSAAAARIVLEEMMNYKVALVARTGTNSAFERVSRHGMYATLEAWESTSYKEASDYYVWGNVLSQPFVQREGRVVWASNGEFLPMQPDTASLQRTTLGIRESPIKRNLQGMAGQLGIFINNPAIKAMNGGDRIADYWRGHQQENTLKIFTPDGTIKCHERLKSGANCTDPQATFYCPSECPSTLWDGQACCIHGKFYPPQCIPEGVTYDEIRADPEWASPYCREFLHGDASWDVAFFEAVITNLKLNYTINYMGYSKTVELVVNRTREGVPTIFYWWKPDPLVTRVNASEVILPTHDARARVTQDPLSSEAAFSLPTVLLTKLVHHQAQALEPDFFKFFQNYAWDEDSMESLLRLHKLGGGDMNIEDAACTWVKTSTNRWIRWVSNEHVGSSTDWIQIVLIACISALVVVIPVVLGIVYWMRRSKYAEIFIQWDQIVCPDPPVVLGSGPMGDVQKAEYRSMVVALKPIDAVKLEAARRAGKSAPSPRQATAGGRLESEDAEILNPTLDQASGDDPPNASDLVYASHIRDSVLRRSVGSVVGRGAELTALPRSASIAGLSRPPVTSKPSLDSGSREATSQLHFLEKRRSLDSRPGMQVLSAAELGSLQELNAATMEATLELKPVRTSIGSSRLGSFMLGNSFRQYSHRPNALLGRAHRHFSRKEPSASEMEANFRKESITLAKIRNPYLISFYGLTLDPKGNITYIVAEYMEESLHELVYNPTVVLDPQVLVSILKNVAAGMNYLHSMDPPVIHGTLQTHNILVDNNLTAKVAEFGLSLKQRPKIFYTAPELLMGTADELSTEQDVYCFGTLVYEVFSRRKPTADRDPHDWLDAVQEGVYNPLELTESQCSIRSIRELCLQCQALDPSERPSFVEINQLLQKIDDTTISQLMHGLANKNRLLDDILPPKVGAKLALGLKVEPEHYDCVTIFFSDIVGFTTISSSQHPEKVMAMLDRLYGKFDQLSKKHGLFKVETIGDAYMAVGNLSEHQPDHAVKVAMFAMDAVTAASQTPISDDDPSLGMIQIRCGFHTGPVVASVVGTANPRYCLFGDTVNTASRMESNSVANCIHLSHAASLAMNAVEHAVPLLYRGCSNIKGKGDMHTYWIFGFHPEPSTLSSSTRIRQTNEGFEAEEGSGMPKMRRVSTTLSLRSHSLGIPHTE